MTSNLSDTLRFLASIQADLRGIPIAGRVTHRRSSRADDDDFLEGLMEVMRRKTLLGCLLFHWNKGRLESSKFYHSHLDQRTGGKPHVFFERLYKTEYAAPGESRTGPAAERQFGISYSGLHPKREMEPLLEAFKRCATRAGAVVASIKESLAAVVPAATLAAKQDLQRWIFTVYDVAWRNPSKKQLGARRYIPVEALDASMRTDESVIYDLENIRATPWSRVKRRLDRWGAAANLKGLYASWREKLPEFYASRIDNIVKASDLAIAWLVKYLERIG